MKFHISRQALVILIVAFVASFLVTVAIRSRVTPEQLSTVERLRLEAENQELQVQVKNAEIRNSRMSAQLEDAERLSHRVNALINTR